MSSRLPLGAIVGARSGDKGGNANIGVWVPDPAERSAVCLAWGRSVVAEPSVEDVALADARFEWLGAFLTIERLNDLLPEVRYHEVDRHELPNLRALNFVIHGLLGRGVADSLRVDPQAKGLGEHLRARLVDIPAELRPSSDTAVTP